MNFLYILTVAMVISSASNGEIYQNGTDDNFCPLNFITSISSASYYEVYQNGTDANFNPSNFTSSAYPKFVPLPIRLAVTTVLILLLMASYMLDTKMVGELFNYVDDITATYLVKMLIYHSFAVGLGFAIAPDQWEFGFLISYGCLVTAGNYEIAAEQMYECIWLLLDRIFGFAGPLNLVVNMIVDRIFGICATVIIGVHYLLACMTVFSVYKENFSAFIPLTILLTMASFGAKLIPSDFGLTLFSTAVVSLMLFVNVNLLATLNSALNDGKSIWSLTTTVIMAILLIFTIRHLIISLVCKYHRGQFLFNDHIYFNFPLTLQMAFICVLGYLTALIYSFFIH